MDSNEIEKIKTGIETGDRLNNSDSLYSILQQELSFRKAIEDSIPGGIAVVDDTGKQVYVNKSFCEMIGWSADELIGKTAPFEYWCNLDIENINRAFQLTLENKAPKEGYELKFCHRSGKIIPVNVVISQINQENGKLFFLASVTDISERKKTEKELLKSQLLFSSSIESQKNSIIFFLDRNYNYIYFNKAHSDAMKYAYNAEIETGKNMLDFMHSPVDQQAARENFERAIRGESFTYLNTFGTVNRDYYEFLINPIRDTDNGIIGCTGIGRNITDRIKAEQALRDSETKFREIIDQINDVIIVFDNEEKIIVWNKGAEKILGYRAEETLGKKISEIRYKLTPPEKRERAQIEKMFEEITNLKSPELFNQIADSEIIVPGTTSLKDIQTTVFPIRIKEGYLFCMVIRDTSEIKRYEREMLRIVAEKDKFYSTIAQYLYTPFSLFRNFAHLMAEELDNLPLKEIQKMAEMMSKSATNLYGLLDNMLQWTKLNQGKIICDPQRLDFNTVIHEAVAILKTRAESNNISINFPSNGSIYLHADLYMFKTILRNLVANSLKFTECGGHIDISATCTNNHAVVTVFNSGSGINSESMKKLFDISIINSSLHDPEERGTSLGLLVCKEFVEKHGGKLWVENIKGKGTEFRFTIPMENSVQ